MQKVVTDLSDLDVIGTICQGCFSLTVSVQMRDAEIETNIFFNFFNVFLNLFLRENMNEGGAE